jgi:uncharacterized protein YcfJ
MLLKTTITTMVALGALVTVNAKSIKVEEQIAITKPFTKKVKVGEKCYDQTIESIVNCQGHEETNSVGLDTIIGGVLGVAVGNQFGKGTGNDVAKVVGGLTGMHIANQDRNNQKCKSYREVTKCDPVYEYQTKELTVGYRNCATYMGQRVCKETNQPLDYLEVTHKIYVH